MPSLTPSILRVVKNVQRVGLKNAWRQLNAIGDIKGGRLVGTDIHGNKFYENTSETMWRHRWVDYASADWNASQVTPEWHSWINHIRAESPDTDPAVLESRQPWQTAHWENLTGTRGAYKPFNTVRPKISAWEPKVVDRS